MADNTFTSRGGRSKYCCVPGCKSSFYNNQGEKTNISFFSFPLEAKSRKRWLLAIKRQENRDGFVVTEYTKVCEQHFRFPASRGLSRRGKNERKERDLCRLPKRCLMKPPTRFLVETYRFQNRFRFYV